MSRGMTRSRCERMAMEATGRTRGIWDTAVHLSNFYYNLSEALSRKGRDGAKNHVLVARNYYSRWLKVLSGPFDLLKCLNYVEGEFGMEVTAR